MSTAAHLTLRGIAFSLKGARASYRGGAPPSHRRRSWWPEEEAEQYVELAPVPFYHATACGYVWRGPPLLNYDLSCDGFIDEAEAHLLYADVVRLARVWRAHTRRFRPCAYELGMLWAGLKNDGRGEIYLMENREVCAFVRCIFPGVASNEESLFY